MGRRRSRKAERRRAASASEPLPPPEPRFLGRTFEELFGEDDDDGWGGAPAGMVRAVPAPAAATCGACHEFVEDAEGGRGTCLHPGSGILAPWTDTAACPFFEGRRARLDAHRERR